METSRASENLQVIRTLMERSAVYRRALAPVMLVSGGIGLAGAALGRATSSFSARAFIILWMLVAAVALITAFLLVRRQALKDAEPFWSPPARRVTRALIPPFFVGLVAAVGGLLHGSWLSVSLLSAVWFITYGCGLLAAGFFLERGIPLLGWVFVTAGSTIALGAPFCSWLQEPASAHCLMGTFFGAVHLACGVYLYFTERKKIA